ncbi:hypothetical protein [Bradyrhizobium acaciae]|uniref:hypothetical protein n=1 Tax=Bradyrhizobium acaciae TaxID=2683706 RepID=UPI001E5ADCBD|nr:hypothetical protein [Bradyrhizobium acaciae]MCC8983346.1 hypothetical protein [Bradyrhizobium acaciae]
MQVLGLSLTRLAARGAVDPHAVELLWSVEKITLADCPVICRCRGVFHAIDRVASHFASALLLAILIDVRRDAKLHQAAYCLGQTRLVFLPSNPCHDGPSARIPKVESPQFERGWNGLLVFSSGLSVYEQNAVWAAPGKKDQRAVLPIGSD